MEHKNDEIEDNGPQLDLKFKEGETIKVNLNIGVSFQFKNLIQFDY